MQFTDVNALVSTTRCETVVGLPVDIECRSQVERKLLRTLSSLCVPYNCRLEGRKKLKFCNFLIETRKCIQITHFVNTSTEDVVSFFVPFKRKNGTLVLAKCAGKSTLCRPDASIPIV